MLEIEFTSKMKRDVKRVQKRGIVLAARNQYGGLGSEFASRAAEVGRTSEHGYCVIAMNPVSDTIFCPSGDSM